MRSLVSDAALNVQEAAYRAGAVIRISGLDIILSPSLILTEQDAGTILSALDAGLNAA